MRMGVLRKLRGGVSRDDRGANLVEFAILVPLLVLLVFGIVEFGYLLGQFNEVRHGAHEGARLAAVDDADLGQNTCDAMGLGSDASVDVDFTLVTGDQPGDQGRVTVTLTVNSLSGLGFIEAFLPASISKTADFKLEQPANWNSSNQDQIPCSP